MAKQSKIEVDEEYLAKAVSEVADAISGYLAEDVAAVARAIARKDEESREARIQWASKLQEAGNLVLGGSVLAQLLAPTIRADVAFAGITIFAGAYLFAYWVMRGGGRK